MKNDKKTFIFDCSKMVETDCLKSKVKKTQVVVNSNVRIAKE